MCVVVEVIVVVIELNLLGEKSWKRAKVEMTKAQGQGGQIEP